MYTMKCTAMVSPMRERTVQFSGGTCSCERDGEEEGSVVTRYQRINTRLCSWREKLCVHYRSSEVPSEHGVQQTSCQALTMC
jgi:hypothetical protein